MRSKGALCFFLPQLATGDFRVTFSWPDTNTTVCGGSADFHRAGNVSAADPATATEVPAFGGFYTQAQPLVEWDAAGDGTLYSLMMLDFDAAFCGKGTKIHWMVLNMAGPVLVGDEVAAFAHPGPPELRFHRYVFLLFNHSNTIVLDDSQRAALEGRINFDYPGFLTDHGLASPVAERVVDAQLDAYVIEYYLNTSGVSFCNWPESCSLAVA